MNCRLESFKAPLYGDVEKDLSRLDQLWQELMAAAGSDGPGLLGELSIVDVYFAPVVFRCDRYQLPLSDASLAYIGKMLDLPAMRAWAEAAAEETEIVEADEFALIHKGK